MADIDVSRLRITVSVDGQSQTLGALAQINRAVDGLRQNVLSGFAFAAGFAAFHAGLNLVQNGMSALGDAMIGLNAQLQQTAIGFETMLGSASAAKTMMADLTNFALNTPFELKGLSKIGGQFLAMGFEGKQIIPLLKDIGNAASALGTGEEGVARMALALAQMSATGKVMAQDMNQLTNAQVPAWRILSEALGKTVGETRKLGEEGKISADVFLQAFERMARGKWGDAMENQNRTFTVALANSKEALQLFAAEGFKPLFELITEGIIAFRDFTKTAEWARWGIALREAVTLGTTALKALLSVLQPVGQAIRGFFNQFADIMGIPQQVIAPAKEIGLAFGDGMKAGLAEANPLEAAIKGLSLPLAQARLAASDIKDAYAAAIDPLKAQADQFAKVADFQADLRGLQLDTEASVLREKEARERILDASKTSITMQGRLRRGKDPTGDLRLLDIDAEQRTQKAKDQLAEIQRQMALEPISAQIKALEAAQKLHLAPIEAQAKAMERQLALLQLQKQEMEALGATAATTAKNVADAAGGGARTGDADSGAGEFGGRVFDLEALKKKGLEIGGAFLGGVGDALGKIPELVGKAFAAVWDWTPFWVAIYDLKAAITKAFSPDGVKAIETFTKGLVGALDSWKPTFEKAGQTIAKWIGDGASADAEGHADNFLRALLTSLTQLSQKWTELWFSFGFGIGKEIGRGLLSWWQVGSQEQGIGRGIWNTITSWFQEQSLYEGVARAFAVGIWTQLKSFEDAFFSVFWAGLVNAIRRITIAAGPIQFKGSDFFPNEIPTPDWATQAAPPAVATPPVAGGPLAGSYRGAGSLGAPITVTVNQTVNGFLPETERKALREEAATAVYQGLAQAQQAGGW